MINMPPSAFTYKNNVKKLCKERCWTATDLQGVALTHIPISTIYKWFRQEKQPGKKYASILLDVFDCTLHELFSEKENV